MRLPPIPLLLHLLLFLHLPISAVTESFSFQGFRGANLSLDGTATITGTGLLRLTNATKMLKSHAFYPQPIRLRSSPSSKLLSFSTTFVFGIQFTEISGHGIVFVLSHSTDFSAATGSQYLGLFNAANNTNSTPVVGVELDTIQNPELRDVNDNHIGIDVNGLVSLNSTPAGYFNPDGVFVNLSLSSGSPLQLWVDYSGEDARLDVRLAPLGESKPQKPLLTTVDEKLSQAISETMFVGFSATTDPFQTSHYILGWSFTLSGEAKLDPSDLPPLPSIPRKRTRRIVIWLPVTAVLAATAAVGSVVLYAMHRVKFSEVVDEWEEQYGPQRFSYKTLFDATKGFAPSELLGAGGFGSVFKGYLRGSDTHLAVKRISHDSKQGIREFVAEIASLGRVRHRNLVQLLGYCRRRRELMLVYEYMPNGSLDKLLFCGGDTALTWEQRVRVIRGVAMGLLYLHEEWEQVVIHRDVKASNVLLDWQMNGKLGDFGLARLYDHDGEARTTHVVGTMGYLAPELTRMGRATKATDVYAFGVFVLEVVTGRRPVEAAEEGEVRVTAEWVLEAWRKGLVGTVVDRRMGGEWVEWEVERVVRLGLLCSHPLATARPAAREVVRILEGEAELPSVSSQLMDAAELDRLQAEAYGAMPEDVGFSYAASFATGMAVPASAG